MHAKDKLAAELRKIGLEARVPDPVIEVETFTGQDKRAAP